MSDAEALAEFANLMDDCILQEIEAGPGGVFTQEMFERVKERLVHGQPLPRCKNCRLKEGQHMPDGKCLFLSAKWSPK